MNSQKEVRLFYKYGKENNLEPLSESKIKKEKEEIQRVFERNMEKIFPKLEFVKTEISFKDKSRADSLAFNPTEEIFYLFEYKTEEGKKGKKPQTIQALEYLNKIKHEKDRDEQEKLVDAY